MIDKRRLLINASSSVVQIFISGVTLFLLYKYLLDILGAEILGIWSLVLAMSSMAFLANLGFTGSIVKYIASYNAVGDTRKMVLSIQTSVISIGFFGLLLIVLLFQAADYYFTFSLNEENQKAAIEILPIALLCFWLFMVTGIYQGALYGCQLIDQRNIILMIDSIFHLILCIYFASEYGLMGLAYARLLQNIITLVLTWIVLKRRIPELPVIPIKWNRSVFREMLGYAVNFQIITLLVMLSDPITKGFLSKYGSVSMVSYYEMANKLVQLLRSVIVSANQVLVPSFASLKELEPHKIAPVFAKSNQVVFFLTLPAFGLLMVSSPIISYFWIGQFEPVFVMAMIVLSGGWLFNTLAVPAYFAGVGTGDMKNNVISHIVMTSMNLLLIALIGKIWQGSGVIVAWAVSLSVGGVLLNIIYFKHNRIDFMELVPKDSRMLCLVSIFSLGLSYFYWLSQEYVVQQLLKLSIQVPVPTDLLFYGSLIACFSLIIIIPVWFHPVRAGLLDWIIKSGKST